MRMTTPADPAVDFASLGRELVAALARIVAPVERSSPLLIDARELARLLSRSVASVERDDASGSLPPSIRLNGSKRWRVEEVRAWVHHGCPPRDQWSAIWQRINRR